MTGLTIGAIVAVLCALGALICALRARAALLQVRQSARRLEELAAEREQVCPWGHPWAYAELVDGDRLSYCHMGHWTFPVSTRELDEP